MDTYGYIYLGPICKYITSPMSNGHFHRLSRPVSPIILNAPQQKNQTVYGM